MIRLPAFAYHRPRELPEACAILAEHGPEAVIVAGGTDVLPKLKRRQLEAGLLVGLRGIPELGGVRRNGVLEIGAGVRLAELAGHPALTGAHAALARAAALVAGPQIRNAATVGGNLCLDTRCDYWDKPYGWREGLGFCLKGGADVCRLASGGSRCWALAASDLAPVAMALDGAVRLVSAEGGRSLPVSDLYRDDGIEHLARRPDEIVAALVLPALDGVRATYLKLRRRAALDFPLLGVAAAVRLAPDGTCEDARLVLGAIASRPQRVAQAERLLVGRPLDEATIAAAAENAASEAKPMPNTDLTPAYRKRMVRVHVARALAELADG